MNFYVSMKYSTSGNEEDSISLPDDAWLLLANKSEVGSSEEAILQLSQSSEASTSSVLGCKTPVLNR